MHVSAVLAVSVALALAPGALGKTLVLVPLQGTNDWIPGERLSLPGNNIKGFEGKLTDYDPKAWNDHIKDLCQAEPQCTSTAVWQTQKWDPAHLWGAEQWYGSIYRGGATKPEDYRRSTDTKHPVTNAQFWTIPASK